jgi:branched-chain amino acid aminotransferase
MTEELLWVNGKLVAPRDARLSVLDHGFTVGDGVFESLKVIADPSGTPRAFALTRHLRRLRRSAEALDLTVPSSDDELRAAVAEVLAAWGGRAPGRGPSPDILDTPAKLRITVTGGADDGAPSIVIALGAGRPRSADAAVVTVPWRRNEHSPLTGVKSTSYADNVIAQREARARGADEAVLANTAGNLCEGTASNVFVGTGGRLVTPPLSSGCLAGVTRELVLELVDVIEEDLPADALAGADEAFLTSSTRGVLPIRSVDGAPLPQCPGPLSAEARKAFDALEASTPDP